VNNLTPEDQALLELAREGDGPSASDRDRIRSALNRRLGVAAGLAAATTITRASALTKLAAGATSAVSAVPLAAKVTIAVAILAGVGIGGAALHRTIGAPAAPERAVASAAAPSTMPRAERRAERADGRMPPAGVPSSPSALLPAQPPTRTVERGAPTTYAGAPAPQGAPAREVLPVGRASSAVATLTAPPPLESAPAAQAIPPPSGSTGSLPPALPATPGAVAESDLDVETALVRAGMEALRTGDAPRALLLFDEHARHFPNGVLAEERAVERILALCQLGRRTDAAGDAATFLRDHPASRLADQVRSSCAQSGSH
jgi:hypothetical protein